MFQEGAGGIMEGSVVVDEVGQLLSAWPQSERGIKRQDIILERKDI